MDAELIGWLIDGALLVSVIGVWTRLEFFLSKRIEREAVQLHQGTAEAVVQDTSEATERLIHLVQNHINGHAHRR